MQEHHISVTRTARYYTLGEISRGVAEVWFVCHGYGQLAERFIRHFAALDDGTRLVVAPEALGRFYLGEVTWANHAWTASCSGVGSCRPILTSPRWLIGCAPSG